MTKLFFRALVSGEALAQLYERRKMLRPSEENRTRAAVASTTVLFLLTMGFLVTMAWMRHDAEAWLAKRPNIHALAVAATPWAATAVVAKTCESGRDCFEKLSAMPKAAVDLEKYALELPAGLAGSALAVTLFRAELDPARFGAFPVATRTLVATLPAFSFRRADLYVDGAFQGTTWDDGRLTYAFAAESLKNAAKPLQVQIVFEAHGEQIHLARAGLPKLASLDKTVAVMPLDDYRAWQEFVASDKAGRGDFIGAIARIAMAVFVLVLFLLIDSSPETLGLGLFLGFEAFAISLGFGWLPLENVDFLKHYAFQMGDIFRIYFFLQLARMIDKRVAPWLLWGTVISIPHGLLRHYGPAFDLTWLFHISRIRDMIAGGIGLAVCVRAAWYLRDKKLPWRVLALGVAALGAFEQVFDSGGQYVPALRDHFVYQTIVDLLQPIAAWLLAFAAFLNISTLENRVRTLSGLEARAKEMEKEMELGRVVQKAFMNLPKMPDELRMVCHHEAMLYVSGDTYFVDWNEKHRKLTFLINDVTGHGVQAALKASGVSVIANTVWSDAQGPWIPGKMEAYARMVTQFFEKMDSTPDVLAMAGGEFDVETGALELFRVNFPFPLVIEPKGDTWSLTLLPLPSAKLVPYQMSDGAFVVLTSDGMLDNSRRTTEFLRYMKKQLAGIGSDLDADRIKALVLACPLVADRKDDDKTLTVFHWQRDAAKRRLSA